VDRRRIALVAAGAVLLGGVVAVLRGAGGGDPEPRTATSAPPPTSLAPFAADGVLVPRAGEPPHRPEGLRVTAGPRRLQVRWSGEEAPGYEVRWGRDGRLDRSRLVARTATQLDGLDDGVAYRVEVRAVDAFGQRSEPAGGEGVPRTPGVGDLALVDRFDQPDAPDPARWRFTAEDDCARATPGRDDDGARLVIGDNCVATAASLRSRTPFALRDADDLGRVVVDTDAPGADGELAVDLVPGPVTAVGGDGLPPGAIRLRVAGGSGGTTAEVLTPEGTPTTATRPLPAPEPGLTHRWELALRRDGARVLLDGEVVATSPATPGWREATALVSVSGRTGRRAAISLVAFDAAPATAPAAAPPPDVRVAVAPDAAPVTGTPLRGVVGGQVRMVLRHTDRSPVAPGFALAVGDARVPLRPAVPGAPWRPGAGYPVVADVPASALVLVDGRLPVTVVTGLPVRATHVDLELTPAPGAPPAPRRTAGDPPANGPEPDLARVVGTVLDAGGRPVPEGSPVPRGRVVFDLTLDGRSGERGAGLVGLAGFTVRLDDERIATVPTDLGGPGVAGSYRLALDTGGLSAGPHTIEVRLHGAAADVRPSSAFVSFFLS